MYEYNNKKSMSNIVKALERQGKSKISVDDVEAQLPENIANRRVNALRIMRELIDNRYIAANDMDGHAFLSVEGRVRNSKENLRCFDHLVLLLLMGEEDKSFEEICDDLFFQASIPSCFGKKCVSMYSHSSDEYISDMYEAVYSSLERLIYADMVEELSDGHFCFHRDVRNDTNKEYEIYERAIDRCYACDTFRKYIQEEHGYLLEDCDFDFDEDDDDEVLDNEDFADLLKDFENLQKKIRGNDLHSLVDESEKDDDPIESPLEVELDILERLKQMYKK